MMSMKIKNLTASVHQFPVYLPMIDEPLEHRVFTFCEVETDEGIKGCGVTGAFLPWSIVAALQHDIWSYWMRHLYYCLYHIMRMAR